MSDIESDISAVKWDELDSQSASADCCSYQWSSEDERVHCDKAEESITDSDDLSLLVNIDEYVGAKKGGDARSRSTLLALILFATLTSSLAICLFPPFFPKIAEEKGCSAGQYGFIIGTNCLTSFLVTPFVGKKLTEIGVKFALLVGIFISGTCCILSGFLEFFSPGWIFFVTAIAIRVVHAVGNALVLTSTFTYSACEFRQCVGKVFSLTRTMMNLAQMFGPSLGGAFYSLGGFHVPFVVMGLFQLAMVIVGMPNLPECEFYLRMPEDDLESHSQTEGIYSSETKHGAVEKQTAEVVEVSDLSERVEGQTDNINALIERSTSGGPEKRAFDTQSKFDGSDASRSVENEIEEQTKQLTESIGICQLLRVPGIWFSFSTFVIATVCNGFLSVSLEPRLLRQFELSPFYVGLIFGVKDGANSVASPIWGWLCDKIQDGHRPSDHEVEKPFGRLGRCKRSPRTMITATLVLASLVVALSFSIMGASAVVGINIPTKLPLIILALTLNGIGIGGQQVTGIIDALLCSSNAGFAENPSMHGLISGMWNSLSGAGRFISRTASGFMVDSIGFNATAAFATSLQLSLFAVGLVVTLASGRSWPVSGEHRDESTCDAFEVSLPKSQLRSWRRERRAEGKRSRIFVHSRLQDDEHIGKAKKRNRNRINQTSNSKQRERFSKRDHGVQSISVSSSILQSINFSQLEADVGRYPNLMLPAKSRDRSTEVRRPRRQLSCRRRTVSYTYGTFTSAMQIDDHLMCNVYTSNVMI